MFIPGLDTYVANCLMSELRPSELYFHPGFFTGMVQNRDTGSFILCTRYDVKPAFYNLSRDRIGHDYLHGPFVARLCISSIKNTSYVIEGHVYDMTTKKLLFRESSQAIVVNLTTRKPQPFDKTSKIYLTAKTFTERLKADAFTWKNDDFIANRSTLDDVAERRRQYHRVTHDDIDVNGHMNISIYFKYAQKMLHRPSYDVMQPTMNGRPMTFSALFAREARLGDLLCFEAHNNANSLLVHVKRNRTILSTIRFQRAASVSLPSFL